MPEIITNGWVDASRPITNVIPPNHRVRHSDRTTVYAEFAQAVLGFHRPMSRNGAVASGMCQCGRTVVECDVLHHARRLGLAPPLT